MGGGEARHIIRTREEHERFLQLYDRYPRTVVSEAQPRFGGAVAPQPLTDVLQSAADRVTASDEAAWRGVVVEVERGDGMTWSAAAADRLLGESSSLPVSGVIAEPRVDRYPQIVELVGKRRLVALAQEKQVVPPLPALRRRSVALAAFTVLLLGAAIAVLQALTDALGGFVLVPLVGAAVAALVLVREEASARLKRSAREADERRLIEGLDEAAEEDSQAWRALVEALSGELERGRRDRAVIVDDFDRLDKITHDTLRHYLAHRSRPSGARELWVVFESVEIATVSKDLNLSSGRAGRSLLVWLEAVRQRGLDERERSLLAAEVGRPERADFHLVRSIVGPEAGAVEAYEELYKGQNAAQRHDPRPYGPLQLAYLLAVQNRTGAWGFREQDLVSDFSSGESSPPRQVLRLLLPDASFNRSEVGDAVRRIELEMGRALDPERAGAGVIELVAEAAEVLVESHDAYGLPAEDVVHLYWALYWSAKLRGAADVDAYCLRKLARHLLHAATPGALGDGVGEAARERFREALVWTARALLAASLPDDVRELLLRAEREAAAGEDHAELRSVCWQAFAVLGDEDMLAIVLRLHPGSTGSPAAPTDPESLFIESLRSANPAPAARGELSQSLLSLDPDVLAYAQVRGIWLALTLDPATTGTWSHFWDVAVAARSRIADLIFEALRSLEDPTRPRAAVSALTASLGTWSYALDFIRGYRPVAEANNLLEDVRLGAAQLHDALDERRQRGESEDYVLRAFANELETVAGAAALLVSMTPAEGSDEDRIRLEDHIAGALDGADLSPEGQVQGMDRQMTLQALTWRTLGSSGRRPLGFEQLAAFMTLRRVHLSVLVTERDGSLEDVLSGLTEQLEEPGAIGLMAHAIAMWASRSEEITAHLWARAVGCASGFGDRLATEVCMAALSEGHAFGSVEKQSLVERLLGGEGTPSAAPSTLSARLAEFDDEARRDAALWLLNTAKHPGLPAAFAETLLAETKAMGEATEDEQAKDEIEQMVELFELERSLELGQAVAAEATLERWEGRRESRHYSWMLHLLIEQPGVGAAVTEAAADYLRSHPQEPTMSGPVILAFELAGLAARGGTAASAESGEVAFGYLDRIHPAMEEQLTIEMNIAILILLLRNEVGDEGRHREDLENWEVARQERDGLRKLPELAEAGRFFLVLWHYYETLSFYGLPTEPEVGIDELLAPDGDAQTLVEWRERGQQVPAAMVSCGAGVCLSADFLRYGRALFGPAAEGAELDEARLAFNKEALESLPRLFDQLRSLPRLSERIRSLLVNHQAQLLRGVESA